MTKNAYDYNQDFNPNSDRTVSTYYFDRKHNLLKRNTSKYPNSAVQICTTNMRLRYHPDAVSAVVFDHSTAEKFADLYFDKKGKLVIDDYTDPRESWDPIRRTLLALIPVNELR